MPKKIEFVVVFASSEDPKYRSTELNTHGPTVKGWQSEKNCEYPQQIILQLERRGSLNTIQILAHQYLIPSKIELFSSNEDTNSTRDTETITWEYIGYITLSDNQNTGFKSRELKSAHVPNTMATYIMLKLCKNHSNSRNNNNHVSLIAINVLGTDTEIRRLSSSENVEDKLLNKINDPEYSSPYDDLAFEMYVDTDVAKVLREMEIKKFLAVINERFEYARKLKQAMEKLRTAGEKLGKYELEKRHAIDLEDYERARHKKNQMDQFRSTIYQEISLDQLLEVEGKCSRNDEIFEDNPGAVANNKQNNCLSPTSITEHKRMSSPNPPHTMTNNQVPVSPLHATKFQSPKRGSPSTGSPTSLQQRGSFRRRNKSAGAITKSTYEMYEDKPLPALRHSQTNEFLRECQIEDKTTSKLTEREKKQAALPILVFGVDLVEKIYSKHYCDKEEGLNKLKEELLSYDNTKMHTANKTARAAIFLLHRALRDKVFSVYSLANEVIRLFFVQFVPSRVSPAEVARSVDKLLPELLTKSGDTSARIHHMAVHTILTMADCKNIRDLHIIPVHLSRPVSSSTHPRLALSRAEMVEQLIINHGISTDKQSGLTCRTLSEFGASGLHHPAEAVRKVSERILVLVYKVNPRLIRKQLPPDDDITRRNLLYRQLFHEFDKIDLERKKEMLEKSRLIQQCSSNLDNGHNAEASPNYDTTTTMRNELNKCPSASSIHKNTNSFNYESNHIKNYPLSKSTSGENIIKNNGIIIARLENESSSSASGISSPSNTSQKEDEEKQCIFCNQTELSILSVSNSMNSHYWRTCPMLVRCKECIQVVEIASLTEHLLSECEKQENYTQCSKCFEAVTLNDYQTHECTEVADGCNKCPLCHENIDVLMWKTHLMGDSPCFKNVRVKTPNQKQVTIQT